MPTDDPAEYFDDLPVLVLQTATLGMVAVCSPKGDEFETVHWRANSIVADACQSCHVTCSYKYRSEALWEAFFCDISNEKSGYIKGACHVKRALSKTHQRQDFSAFEASSAPHWLDIADSRAKKRLQLTRAKRVKHDCWNFLYLIIIMIIIYDDNDNHIMI